MLPLRRNPTWAKSKESSSRWKAQAAAPPDRSHLPHQPPFASCGRPRPGLPQQQPRTAPRRAQDLPEGRRAVGGLCHPLAATSYDRNRPLQAQHSDHRATLPQSLGSLQAPARPHGLIQPIGVVEGKDGFTIVAGGRRYSYRPEPGPRDDLCLRHRGRVFRTRHAPARGRLKPAWCRAGQVAGGSGCGDVPIWTVPVGGRARPSPAKRRPRHDRQAGLAGVVE